MPASTEARTRHIMMPCSKQEFPWLAPLHPEGHQEHAPGRKALEGIHGVPPPRLHLK